MKKFEKKFNLIHLKGKEAISHQFTERFIKVYRSKWRTDKEFLIATGYDKKQLHRLKGGKGNPTLFSIITLANAIGVSPKEFFNTVFYDETATYEPNYILIAKKEIEEFQRVKHEIQQKGKKTLL